jgi:hypothetical protein
MKHLLTILLVSICLSGYAQEKHFIFIQSDNGQPFYVSLNGKLFSSSASGYVIIPKLAHGTYNFSIGFAQNAFPEQTFQYSINKKDLGFNLKNFGDKGWGLFNLQSLDVTMATESNTNNVARALTENAKSKETDEPLISFDKKKEPAVTKVEAVAPVADTSANEQVAKIEEPINPIINNDTLVATTDQKNEESITSPAVADPPIQKETPAQKETAMSDVKKVSEVKAAEGVYLTYSEKNGKNIDTIQVIIPSSPSNNKNVVNASNTGSVTDPTTDKEVSPVSSGATKPAKADPKFLDVNLAGIKKDSLGKDEKSEDNSARQENVTLGNSNCKNIATDDDFTKLKRKMATLTSDEKMISEARKVYRSKCFTTSQIKGLSTLFLSDEGRFKFFDASYLSVSDATSYATLQSEFIDPAYLQRFKAMLQ